MPQDTIPLEVPPEGGPEDGAGTCNASGLPKRAGGGVEREGNLGVSGVTASGR